VLLTFLESKCKEACPIIASQLARAIERLTPEQRGQVVAIAISTHPTDDTPGSVRAFLRARRADGKLHYLVGSERELRPVWERFGVLSALDSGDADAHSASVRVYDRSGEWVASLHPGIDLAPANLVHDVRVALKGETPQGRRRSVTTTGEVAARTPLGVGSAESAAPSESSIASSPVPAVIRSDRSSPTDL
jgi:cytochrome oxidase Cu insertion factor (SCO1/SenC/PrrC family)